MEKEIIRHYSNGEVTITWQPGKCTHSTLCFRGLPAVFDPARRPWVDAVGASTEERIEQVKKCPSGALSYTLNRPEKQESTGNAPVSIDIMPGGPLILRGECTIRYADGTEGVISNTSSFCRCGHTNNSPFCDGSHYETGFKG